MNGQRCPAPLAWDALLAYWLAELDPQQEAEVEQHYLGCERCSRRLAWLVDLARACRAVMHRGAVSVVLDHDFVRGLGAQGMQVREYRVARNGSVNCTVAPEDDLVVGRLQAPLQDVARLDLVYLDETGQPASRHRDIPFAADTGEVLLATRLASLRALPKSTVRLHLVAVGPDGEHTLGEYTFNHTPYNG